MPKLRPLSAAEVCKILGAHGFVRVRQSGSHIILRRQLPGGDSATVPEPNKREIPKGSAQIHHRPQRAGGSAVSEVKGCSGGMERVSIVRVYFVLTSSSNGLTSGNRAGSYFKQVES